MQDSIPQNDAPLKRCSRCPEDEQWHPATSEFFNRDKSFKDGLYPHCRRCVSERRESYSYPRKSNKRSKNKPWHCIQCGETDITKTYIDAKGHRLSRCKICSKAKSREWAQNNRERYLARGRAWRDANPQRHREYRYGILAETFYEMLQSQAGLCAICGDVMSSKHTHVDHDHKTGQIRGLLCNFCNHMIGEAKENPNILIKAAEYLRAWEVVERPDELLPE